MNIAVFASGRGSNFQAILNSIDAGSLTARVVVLIGNNSGVGAMEIARTRSIPANHISQKMFPTEEKFAEAILKVLSEYQVDLIALAGFMKKIPSAVIRQYRNKIVNIHPALLPSFGGSGMYGYYVHSAVIASGAKVTGATVHFVDEEYDRGPILMQKAVNVAPNDTPESLSAKVLKVEHEIYPLVLKAFAEGKIRLEGKKAWVML